MMQLPSLFKKKSAEVSPVDLGERADNMMTMMELLGNPRMTALFDKLEKNLIDASTYFQAFENGDDSGNYFGEEFNIRATAGRIKAAYSKEPWMKATGDLLARTMAMVPFKVVDAVTNEDQTDHPLNQKLKACNRFQGVRTLNWCGYIDLVLGGNYFLVFDEFFQTAMQVPVELVTLQLDPATRQIINLMIWDNKLGVYAKTVPYKQCVHMKLPNPYSMFYGLSWFIAASRPIILDRTKQEFEMAFYLRGATNTGVIETTEDINKTRMERLMRTYEQVYTGKRNWWRTIFLPKGSKWVRSGLTMTEMQHLEGLRENRLTFLASVGVPPSKVGIVQDVNRATSEVQDETFWLNTIKPLVEFAADSWNNSYLVSVIYGGRVRVEADFSGIEALNGSLVSQGEQAKAVEPYWKLDEIREKIFKMDPMGDDRGNKLLVEIKPVASPFGGGNNQSSLAIAEGVPGGQVPAIETIPDAINSEALSQQFQISKAAAALSQERIEKKLASSYLKGYAKYHDQFMTYVQYALREDKNVKDYIAEHRKELARIYVTAVGDDLYAAMERGFAFANAQAKAFSGRRFKAATRFREIDREAIDALRREQAPGKREALARRSIESFVGFNETDTNRVVGIIADELEKGKTTDQIAASIRSQYEEDYSGQSSTIARTEVLSAVSEGIKWNHDVLSKVFTEVQKQWYHVGDGPSNVHARENHIGFEGEGPVESDYKWGGILDYPRDPNGGPEEVINCRCTMVSVIPDSADSNAETIMDDL